MKLLVLCAAMLSLVCAEKEAWENHEKVLKEEKEEKHHWAVLVAGSNTYANYRH